MFAPNKNTTMKYFLTLLLGLLFLATPSNARDKDEEMYNYELEGASGSFQLQAGWNVVKVWSIGKRESLTKENCMRNAIHGIMFKGFPGYNGNSGIKALVPEGYEAHKDFFDDFFESGKFKQFVQLTNNGMLQAGDVISLEKKRYKIGMIVMVNTNALREYLEQANIAKGLDFLFKDN